MTGSLKIRIAAAVAAAGLLAISAQPAAAQQYAFGFSGYDGAEELIVTTTTGVIDLNTNSFQGWVDNFSSNTGGPGIVNNTNYIVGTDGPNEFWRDYFGFNISGFTGLDVTGVTLQVTPFTINNTFTLNLYNASGLEGSLNNAVSPNASLYNAMTSGDHLGGFALNPGMTDGPLLEFALNSTAVADLNAAIAGDDTYFVIAGSVTPDVPVPEPAAWALMLAGFAGLGAAVRLRRRMASAA